MISHQYQCVFIHIPKTAGSSIEKRLGHFEELERGVQDHSTLAELEPLSAADWTRAGTTAGAKRVLKRLRGRVRGDDFLTREQFDRYFKFSFVRNSWARVHSWYKNVMRDPVHRKRLGVPDECSLASFLTDHGDQWALKSQLSWISDASGRISMDFVGRFESLEPDFAHVCEVLKIGDEGLPRLLESGGDHYRESYDDVSREAVARIYADEIEHFSFQFDA